MAIQHNNTVLPNIGLGEEVVSGVNYNGTFNITGGDDDAIGFVFGYEDDSHFYVVLSGKNQSSNWDPKSFQIKKVNSTTGRSTHNLTDALRSSESVEGQTEVLWSEPEDRGWLTDVEYRWILKYRPKLGSIHLQMYEESALLFDTGVINLSVVSYEGKMGVFTHSQPSSHWYKMTYECNDDPI